MALGGELYFHVEEIAQKLRDLVERKGDVYFIVPSGQDQDRFLEILGGERSWWGERPCLLTWQELFPLFRKFTDANDTAGDTPSLKQVDPLDRYLIVRGLVERFVDWARVCGLDLPPGVALRGFIPLLGDQLRELLNEEVPQEVLCRMLFEEKSPDETSADIVPGEICENCPRLSEPLGILCRLYGDYKRELEEGRFLDSAQIPTMIRELFRCESLRRWSAGRTFVWVGFLSFTGGQARCVREIALHADVYAFVPYSGVESFKDVLEQLGIEVVKLPRPRGDIVRLCGANPRLQYEHLAKELRLWREGAGELTVFGGFPGFSRVAVQTPAERMPLLTEALDRFRIPWFKGFGETVASTPLMDRVTQIWNAFRSDWNTRLTASLLCGQAIGQAGQTEQKVLSYQKLLASRAEGGKQWSAFLAPFPQAAAAFGAMRTFCARIERGGMPAVLFAALFDLCECLKWADAFAGEASSFEAMDRHVRELASAVRELEKKRDSLGEKAQYEPSPSLGEPSFFSGSDALFFLSQWASSTQTATDPPLSGGVKLFAVPPESLASFDVWVLTDVEPRFWPGRIQESPLMNERAREKINVLKTEGNDLFRSHLVDLLDERRQKEALFRRVLAAGRKGVILCRSRTDDEGRPVGESPFAKALGEDWHSLAERDLDYGWMLPHADTLRFERAEVACEDAFVGARDTPRRLYVSCDLETLNLSDLDMWVDCPFRYACVRILRLPETGAAGFDTRLAGVLLHEIWRRAWTAHLAGEVGEEIDGAAEVAGSLSRLTRRFWEPLGEKFYPALLHDPKLRRHAIRLREQVQSLAALMDEMALRMTSRSAVSLELPVGPIEVGGVFFQGRCDRIDRFGERAVILDYKLGKSVSHSKELQLAAYAVVLSRLHGVKPAGVGWLGHTDGKFSGIFASGCDDVRAFYVSKTSTARVVLEERMEIAWERMEAMAAGVRSGAFVANYSAQACSYCSFRGVCRKGGALVPAESEGDDE